MPSAVFPPYKHKRRALSHDFLVLALMTESIVLGGAGNECLVQGHTDTNAHRRINETKGVKRMENTLNDYASWLERNPKGLRTVPNWVSYIKILAAGNTGKHRDVANNETD
ncbi:hypothetical protein CBL_08135 [Carabus blaptoides fortunei]